MANADNLRFAFSVHARDETGRLCGAHIQSGNQAGSIFKLRTPLSHLFS
jgi:hypothetical protein